MPPESSNGKEAIQSIGMIGVGALGGNVAQRLASQGLRLTIFDRDNARAHYVSAGAMEVAGTPTEAAQVSDLVITCVPDGDALRTAILGEHGVVFGLEPGAIVMDISTVFPADSQEVAHRLAASGVKFVDCPVGRTADEALRGRMVAMIGGEPETVAAVRPVVELLASDIVLCGPVGSGAKMKLVNNLCTLGVLFVTIEAIAAGEQAGLTRDVMMNTLSLTNARNGHLESTLPKRVFTGDHEPGFRVSLGQKDVRQAIEYLSSVGARLPVSGGVLPAITALRGIGSRCELVLHSSRR